MCHVHVALSQLANKFNNLWAFFYTHWICNFINSLISSWVRSFTELDLSDTDNIVPFENTSPISDNLLCVLLFWPFYFESNSRPRLTHPDMSWPTETQPIHSRVCCWNVTLPWPWTWTFVVCRLCRDQSLYQVWAQSSNLRRSYCDLNI